MDNIIHPPLALVNHNFGDPPILLVFKQHTFTRAARDPETMYSGFNIEFNQLAQRFFGNLTLCVHRRRYGGYNSFRLAHFTMPLSVQNV